MTNENHKERSIQYYNSSQKILLVGEGDFSFSACLAKAFGDAANMVATSLHSEETLPLMHRTSREHLEELKKLGLLVLYEVDVHVMDEHPISKHMKFDVIVFNFPMQGIILGYVKETTLLFCRLHQDLIGAYFRTAKEMLQGGGEIHETLKNDDPYNPCEVEDVAKCADLQLKEIVEFRQENHPGYHNKTGGNLKCNKNFPLKECYTSKFTLQVSALEISDGSEVNDSSSSEVNSITTTR